MTITICESFRAVFYTPFYLPHALGFYAREGLDVELGSSPNPDLVAAHLREALLSGGLISNEIPYEACVDMRFADAVIGENPPLA